MFRWVVVLGWLVATTSAHAEPRELAGPAIKHLVSGTVMHINTPLNTIIPVHYGADGSLAANAGAMGFYLGAKEDTGRWWVSRTRLCHKWTRWFDGDAQCLKLRKSGNKVFWESQKGETGTARIKRTKPSKPDVQVAAASQGPVAKPTSKSHITRSAKVQKKRGALQKPASSQTTFQIASLGAGAAVKKNTPKPAARIKKVTPKKSSVKVPKTMQKKRAKKARVEKRKVVPAVKRKSAKSRKADKALRQTSWQMNPSFRVTHVSELDVLNIRKRPSEYSPIVGAIPHRARGVKIVGACQAWWCPVAHGATKGWVNRFYLVAER